MLSDLVWFMLRLDMLLLTTPPVMIEVKKIDLNELVFNSAVVSLLADLQCEVWEKDHLSSRTERFENGAGLASTISSSSGRRGRTRLAILG